MAPKRTKRESGSSSQPDFDVDFDENRFVSVVAQTEYNRLRGWPIAKERGFQPSSNEGELLAMMEERGWQLICEEPDAVPMGIVREFYANAKIEKNGYSYVRGTIIDYRPETIRALLRQPAMPEGGVDWVHKTRDDIDLDNIVTELCVPGTVWKYRDDMITHLTFAAKAMNKYARALNLFICANLMQSSHTHNITVDRALLLWGIIIGEYVDLGYLINQNMIKFMQGGTTGAIPHASIVTRLVVAAGITWGGEEQMQLPSSAIDGAFISRTPDWDGGIPHHRGMGYIIEGAETPPHQAAPPQRAARGIRVDRAGPSRVRHVMTDSQYRRLTRRIDASHSLHRQFAVDLVNVLDRLHIDQGVHAEWPDIRDYGPYPPPDSPPEEGGDADQ